MPQLVLLVCGQQTNDGLREDTLSATAVAGVRGYPPPLAGGPARPIPTFHRAAHRLVRQTPPTQTHPPPEQLAPWPACSPAFSALCSLETQAPFHHACLLRGGHCRFSQFGLDAHRDALLYGLLVTAPGQFRLAAQVGDRPPPTACRWLGAARVPGHSCTLSEPRATAVHSELYSTEGVFYHPGHQQSMLARTIR